MENWWPKLYFAWILWNRLWKNPYQLWWAAKSSRMWHFRVEMVISSTGEAGKTVDYKQEFSRLCQWHLWAKEESKSRGLRWVFSGARTRHLPGGQMDILAPNNGALAWEAAGQRLKHLIACQPTLCRCCWHCLLPGGSQVSADFYGQQRNLWRPKYGLWIFCEIACKIHQQLSSFLYESVWKLS